VPCFSALAPRGEKQREEKKKKKKKKGKKKRPEQRQLRASLNVDLSFKGEHELSIFNHYAPVTGE